MDCIYLLRSFLCVAYQERLRENGPDDALATLLLFHAV